MLLGLFVVSWFVAGCSTKIEGPTPKLDATVTPAVACNGNDAENAGIRTTIKLTSPDKSFSPLPVNGLATPSIELPKVFLEVGGKDVAVPEVHFVSTGELDVTIDPSLKLPAGTYSFIVQNPNGNRSVAAGELRIVDPPVVTSVTAQSHQQNGAAAQICTSIDNTLTITGTGFRPQDAAPAVTVMSCTDPAVLSTCTTVTTVTGVHVDSPTQITGTLPGGASGLPPGNYAVRVTNPEVPPCTGTDTTALVVVPPPTVTAITPDSMCPTQTNVTITGTGFHGATTASIGDQAVAGAAVQNDTTLTGTAPTTLAPGVYDVTVTIPEGCSATLKSGMTMVAPPTITSVVPSTVCGPLPVTVTGSGYHGATTLTVGGQAATGVAVQNDTTLTATTPYLTPGTYDATVTIPEGCSATLASAFTYKTPNIVVASIIPGRGWTGIDNPVTIFGTGFSAGNTVALVGAATGGGDLALVSVNVDPSGTRIDAIVPKGGASGGPYSVVVYPPAGVNECPGVLPAGFTIDAQPAIDITGIIPPFGWKNAKTPVTITGTGFMSTPRAWLIIPGMTPPSVPLKSTAFVRDTSITSVVPAALPVGGPYDLVVINPDGGGGLLAGAFRVTNLPPPTIDNVTPGTGDTQNPVDITITGCNFRDPVTVDAVTSGGAKTSCTVKSAPVCNGAPGCANNTNHCTLTATVPANTMTVDPYVIRVTDTDENTWGDYSIFVVTNPSAKLDAWTAGPDLLTTGRRAHAGVSGRINAASRFLYAIGGDTGTGGTVLDTVEVVPIDIFGGIGGPFQQRYRLNTPRTKVSAVQSGGYIWVIGGTTDGSTPLGTIERAKILGDADVPQMHDPTTGGGSLGTGAWYYRVAAVKPASDPDNPSGETLPSDEVVVSFLQAGSTTLSWDAVPSVVAYRIYRTPTANGVSSTEVFLAEVPSTQTTYTDDGTVNVDTTRIPLGRGSTGVWIPMSVALVHPRYAHQVQLAHDPAGAPFVYAVGGSGSCSGGATGPMNCYELASISTDGATLQPFTAGTQTMLNPRASFGFAIAENANASQVPVGTTYVFASGGVGATFELEAAQITAGGQIGAFTQYGPSTPGGGAKPGMRNGYALLLINNALYLNGGVAGTNPTGTPLDGTQFSVQFTTPLPQRTSFSSGSVVMTTPRYEHSVVIESGFFYAIGGSTDGALSNAVGSIEATIY